jgi:hypothetical protein
MTSKSVPGPERTLSRSVQTVSITQKGPGEAARHSLGLSSQEATQPVPPSYSISHHIRLISSWAPTPVVLTPVASKARVPITG